MARRYGGDLVLVGIDDASGLATGQHRHRHIRLAQTPDHLPAPRNHLARRTAEPEDGSSAVLAQRRDRQMIIEPVEVLIEEFSLVLVQPAAFFQAARALEETQSATGLGTAQSGLKANEHGSLHFDSKRE